MDRKMIMGLGLLLGLVSIALFTAPIQALANGDMLGPMGQDGQGIPTQDCEGKKLQQQTRQGLRTQDGNCTGDCEQNQCQSRLRRDQDVPTSVYDCMRNTEQHRIQNNK